MKEEYKRIITDYISAYNNFDISGMTRHLDEKIVFENISSGQVSLRIDGLTAFIQQADTATAYFKQREQRITSWAFSVDKVEVEIAYRGVLALDLPNGLKAGETLTLSGKSEFKFLEGRVISLRDIS